MEQINEISQIVKDCVSSNVFIGLIIVVSLYFSIRMIFPQFRFFGKMISTLLEKDDKSDKGISPFQGFAIALGSRVGVGNVAGIATAIATGGPGAIFWIWIFGLIGSAVAIVEAVLGQAYKEKRGDEYLGGPAYYIKKGIKNPFISKYLSIVFAVLAIIGMGVLLPGVQSNTVVNSIEHAFHTDKTATVIVAAIGIAFIIWGGIKRIGKVEAYLTPLKCFLYLAFSIVVIAHHWNLIGDVFYTIISSALGAHPIFGGILGSAIAMGIRRGIFSTDVGYGPGGSFAAAARCNHPMKQGLLQGLSVLLSTLIICTATALIILMSGSCQVVDISTNSTIYTGALFPGVHAGAEWVQAGLDSCEVLEGWAPGVLAFLIAIFALGTIVGYYYLIESNLKFLVKKENKILINFIKVVFLVTMVASTLIEAEFIWNLADIGMGLMGWINILVLVALSPKAISIVKDYAKDIKQGNKLVFKPEKYGIKDETNAWKLEE